MNYCYYSRNRKDLSTNLPHNIRHNIPNLPTIRQTAPNYMLIKVKQMRISIPQNLRLHAKVFILMILS